MPTTDTFAVRLRALLDERGVTIAELARQSGLHRVTIHALLRGDKQPSLDTFLRIADALGGLSSFDGLEKSAEKTH